MRLHVLRIQRCFYGFYCVTEEDLKIFNRNLLACLQEDTSSLCLLRVARWGVQIVKYFSHRHKLHRLKEGLWVIGCFKIFKMIWKFMLLSLRFHTCLLSSLLILLLGLLNDVLLFACAS